MKDHNKNKVSQWACRCGWTTFVESELIAHMKYYALNGEMEAHGSYGVQMVDAP